VVSTELLWFLHHHLFDLRSEPSFDARLHAAWRHFREINDSFATACAEHAAPGGTVLIQDYHLSLAPRRLRTLRPDVRSAHFTMTPWAAPDHFATLPEGLARELLSGMLGADMVSFLVPRWADAFLECCARAGLDVDRSRGVVRDEDGHESAVRCFPVGVDGEELTARASTGAVAAHRDRLAARVGDAALVLRVDRMDPAKNVLRGLAAYAELLEREPSRRGRVVHFVHAYSSRGDLPAYRRYADQVRALVADINDRLGNDTWQPVILETGNDFDLAIAAMSLADVLVVNPLRDGMNLVAKEAAVVSTRGVALVLSRFAGAADDLADGCVLVDPFDVSALAAELSAALGLPGAEREARLATLRKGATALPPREWLVAVRREMDLVTAR
jgi:trehalose 6-phosphate synthase